jgi:hypothetical protein
MEINTSSVVNEIARTCRSELRFLIYLLRCSSRQIPRRGGRELGYETRSEDIFRNVAELYRFGALNRQTSFLNKIVKSASKRTALAFSEIL